MKVYPDANIYVAYLLGERNEQQVDQFFALSLACRFSVVASQICFREIQLACGEQSKLLLQHHLDSFRSAGKLSVLRETRSDLDWAIRLNKQFSGELGLNDWLHVCLARQHLDVLVSNDRRLLLLAKPFCKSLSLNEFLDRL
ncbi:PIN domain-containing protein [Candidatus Micrarchaeota archaeon]|nr:PIN domain-containing protein [Candidatus Micrarchaeota archaeon]